MTIEERTDWLCRLRADLNNGVIFTPWNKEFIEALTEILEQTHCEDCISREDAMSMVLCYGNEIKAEVMDDIKASTIKLPSVTPQQKRGKWVKVHPLQADDEGAYMCSCCGVGDYNLKGTETFCPNCGAKMGEENE